MKPRNQFVWWRLTILKYLSAFCNTNLISKYDAQQKLDCDNSLSDDFADQFSVKVANFWATYGQYTPPEVIQASKAQRAVKYTLAPAVNDLLKLALYGSHLGVVKFLVEECGCDLAPLARDGWDMAIRNGNADMLNYLAPPK